MSEPAGSPQAGRSGESNGAEERIRTSTILRSPAPQAGASAVPPLPRARVVAAIIADCSIQRADYCFGGVVVPAGAVVVAPVAGVPGGVGVGVTVGAFGALIGATGAVPLTTELEPPRPMIDSTNAPTMKSTDRIAVAFDSTVAPARAPNADWLLPPPNAAAMSPLPCWSRMTSSKMRQVTT